MNDAIMSRCGVNDVKLIDTFKLFDRHVNSNAKVIIAFSGGKDSTTISLLFYMWLEDRGRSDINLLLLHNDTLSEIWDMELWTREFGAKLINMFKKVGAKSEFKIVTPSAKDTFYWRVLIKGYPAPTYKFRWCTWLFKRKPTENFLRHLNNKDIILILGSRNDESPNRARFLKARFIPGSGTAYHIVQEINKRLIKSLLPIKDWSTSDVMAFLKKCNKEFKHLELSKILKLYAIHDSNTSTKVRYGCWHCTLIKRQEAHYVLRGGYYYYEALRILYRRISDMKTLRVPKNYGYSRFGSLNIVGRALMYYLIKAAEELSGIRMYGLDEAKIDNIALREILYGDESNADPEATQIINIIRSMKPEVKRVLRKITMRSYISDVRDAMEYLIDYINDL